MQGYYLPQYPAKSLLRPITDKLAEVIMLADLCLLVLFFLVMFTTIPFFIVMLVKYVSWLMKKFIL